MSRTLAGLALILGGVLHALSGFLPQYLTGRGELYLFLTTDILLTIGLIGFYSVIASKAGIAALIGFVAVIASMLMMQNEGIYGSEALIFAIGLGVMGVAAVATRSFSWPAAILWVVGLVVLLTGVRMPGLPYAFDLGTILFSVGFILAGLDLRKRSGHH